MAKLFTVFLVVSISLFSISVSAQNKQTFAEQPIFQNGEEAYACYRIPAIVRGGDGRLLAFAEGRKNGCSDFGNVDIVLKTSIDNGQTWSGLKVVVDNGALQAGNPAPVVDLQDPSYPDGRLLLVYNTGNNGEYEVRHGNGLREVWLKTSTDQGLSWSEPRNITKQTHRPLMPKINSDYDYAEDWRSYALTPGHAIQLKSGRIYIAANHSAGPPKGGFNEYQSHAIFSDDHGANWEISESVKIPSSNEAMAVELTDGRVMMNIRQQNGENRQRLIAISLNEGRNWNETYFDSTLIDPVCQASIINYQTPGGYPALLFSNPASTKYRNQMTVRMSLDDGKTWSIERTIRTGPSAYSDLVEQSDGRIGLLYEHGNDGGIHYAHFNFAWLIGDADQERFGAFLQKLQGIELANSQAFQIASPRLVYDKTFLVKPERVRAAMEIPGAVVRYTLDGTKPESNDPILKEELMISGTATLKARAFHPDFKASEVIAADFFKVPKSFPVKDIRLIADPSPKYPGSGPAGLVDLKKGSENNFSSSAWMGFNGQDFDARVTFKKAQTISQVTVSLLSNPGAWIFAPRQIEIYASDDGKDYTLHKAMKYEPTRSDDPGGQHYEAIRFPTLKTKYLRVLIKDHPIPEWHPGKGTPAWLFVDELIFEQ